MKRILPVSIIVIAAVIGVWIYTTPPCVNTPRAVFSQGWDNSYEVKVEADPALCSYFPGDSQSYVFSSRIAGAEKWSEITRLHYDDHDEARIDNVIKSVNSSVAFAHLNDVFIVTTDGAKTWAVWKIENHKKEWKNSGRESIT
jgi:hypothetical protein